MTVKHAVLVTESKVETRNLTPVRAIRLKCLECGTWSAKEVRECRIDNCALFPFRFGKNPSRKGICGDVENLSRGTVRNGN